MAGIGAPELIVVLLIVLVVFGGAKLPKLARSLGQAQKEFKSGMAEGAGDDDTRPESPRPELPVARPGTSRRTPALE